MWLVQPGEAVRHFDEDRLPSLGRTHTDASLSSMSTQLSETIDAVGGTIEAARIVFFCKPNIYTILGV